MFLNIIKNKYNNYNEIPSKFNLLLNNQKINIKIIILILDGKNWIN